MQFNLRSPAESKPKLLIAFAIATLCLIALPGSAQNYKVAADANGVWSFVTPSGDRFFSLGVNNISPTAFSPRPGTTYYDAAKTQFGGDTAAWGRASAKLLTDHGFNTIGCWSGNAVPTGEALHRTIILYVAGHTNDRCLSGFRPGFEEFVRSNIRIELERQPDRKNLIGVFLDNEAPWYGRFGWPTGATFSLLERAMELEPTDAARVAALDLLKERHKTIAAMNEAWNLELKDWSDITTEVLQTSATKAAHADRLEFTKRAAERFFPTAAKIAREMVPGALILGVRFAGNAPDPVIVEDGKVSDVISLNDYRADPTPDLNHFTRFWLLGKRPIVITEFAWRAKENASGNPNSRGAGTVLATQADRAAAYKQYVSKLAEIPVIIGAHWFEFADQSPQGRFDGEDSNYGIVDLKNRPYTTLLTAMRETHEHIPAVRSGKLPEMPTKIAEPPRVKFTAAQRPERPPTVSMMTDWVREPEVWGAPDSKMAWRFEQSAIRIDFDTGETYGGGLNFFGPAAMRLGKGPAESTDLDGYSAIEIDFEAPRGLQLCVVLAEASAAPPGQPSYSTGAGDDGEAFLSDAFFSKGERTRMRIAIADLQHNMHFGNQRGQRTIDTAALRNLGIQIQGRPRTGTFVLHEFRLVR